MTTSKRLRSRLFALALAAGAALTLSAEAQAQTTFTACRVPDVGAIYMIGVAGAPASCLDPSHVEFSWTEGGTLGAGSVTTENIADGAVTQAKLDPAITLGIGAGDVGTAELADDAVTSAKIADGEVASVDIADGGVATVDLADGAVTTDKIAADAITSAQVALDALTRVDIAPDAITSSEIDDNAVLTNHIADGTITAADLASNSVAAAEIAAGAVGSSELATGLIQWAKTQAAGNVFASSGGVTGVRVQTGLYRLTFTTTLGTQSNCALVGTAAEGAHIVQTVHGARVGQGNNVLQVNLFNALGAAVDGGFEVLVVCN